MSKLFLVQFISITNMSVVMERTKGGCVTDCGNLIAATAHFLLSHIRKKKWYMRRTQCIFSGPQYEFRYECIERFFNEKIRTEPYFSRFFFKFDEIKNEKNESKTNKERKRASTHALSLSLTISRLIVYLKKYTFHLYVSYSYADTCYLLLFCTVECHCSFFFLRFYGYYVEL